MSRARLAAERADKGLASLPRPALVALALVLLAIVGAVDHFTGRYVNFSVFYLVPVTLVVWAGGRPLGILVSIVCAVTWGTIDYLSGIDNPYLGYEVWNSCIKISFFLIVTFLLTGLRDAYRRERHLARIDGLTGALNRRTFVELLEAELRRSARGGAPIALAYFDLDDFKIVNDSKGHAEGDAVLREVVSVARGTLRATDAIARMGGDEFAIVLLETDAAAARTRFESLASQCKAAMSLSGWPTGLSMGVVAFETARVGAEAALHEADELARAVKARGKGGVAFAIASGDLEHMEGAAG